MLRRRALTGLALAGLIAVVGFPQTIKFTTDWVWQGVYAPYLVGVYKGFYAQEGLTVTVDRGYGSADAAAKIAARVYDFGVVDLAVLVDFNARNVGDELIAVSVIYDFSPLCVMTLVNRGIKSPKDLPGRKIAAPAGAAARVLFPAFAKAVGIDPASVEWVTVTAALREPMLIRGEVDATAPFLDAMLTLKAANVREEDIVVFHYPQYGLELLGLALVTRKDVLREKPAVVAAMVRAIIRSWQWSIENPDEMISILVRHDPLVDPRTEKERFLLAVDRLVMTENTKEHGFGYVKPERLQRHIDTVTETLGLPRKIPIDLLYTSAFLPPLENRSLPELRR